MSDRDAMSSTCWTKQYEEELEKEKDKRNKIYGSGTCSGVGLERKEEKLGTTHNFLPTR